MGRCRAPAESSAARRRDCRSRRCSKSDDAVPVTGHLGTARGVGVLLFAMLPAIELDHELSRGTREIGGAPADRVLPTEFPRRNLVPESVPQNPLDIGGIAAKPPRNERLRAQRHYRESPPPPPDPLRPPGRRGRPVRHNLIETACVLVARLSKGVGKRKARRHLIGVSFARYHLRHNNLLTNPARGS